MLNLYERIMFWMERKLKRVPLISKEDLEKAKEIGAITGGIL